LVQDIIVISNTAGLEGVHVASNFPIHEILRDLNMAEIEIRTLPEITINVYPGPDEIREVSIDPYLKDGFFDIREFNKCDDDKK
jgi:hypothetical protein